MIPFLPIFLVLTGNIRRAAGVATVFFSIFTFALYVRDNMYRFALETIAH